MTHIVFICLICRDILYWDPTLNPTHKLSLDPMLDPTHNPTHDPTLNHSHDPILEYKTKRDMETPPETLRESNLHQAK